MIQTEALCNGTTQLRYTHSILRAIDQNIIQMKRGIEEKTNELLKQIIFELDRESDSIVFVFRSNDD